jgi:hypothetical protein
MDERLNRWEVPFQRALILVDSVRKIEIPVDGWTFGGGTVLMRRHRHRFSKDIDIFINDPQFLGYLTPRLSPTAESLTTKFIEDHNYVKLVFSDRNRLRGRSAAHHQTGPGGDIVRPSNSG